MPFDPSRPPAKPRLAASIVLVREARDELEVFLLRRHKGASFMSSAFVFPGGAADPGESDLRAVAIRELLEEAGVLLCDGSPAADVLGDLRTRLASGEPFDRLLAARNLCTAVDELVPLAHWMTPSAEAKRFSARFFLARLPPGQVPSFDNVETVDQLWTTPREALARAQELRLPPPQVHTLALIEELGRSGPATLMENARERQESIETILPRFAPMDDEPSGFALLLPWDPDYAERGLGEAIELSPSNPIARGPSRFVLRDKKWCLVEAPR